MKFQKFLCILLVFLLSIGMVQIPAWAGESESAVSVQINLSAQVYGTYLFAPIRSVSVSSDTAERYGFTDAVTNGVSALDALVQLHADLLDEAFTKENAADYLVVSSGYVSKLFGEEADSGFVLNGMYPHDGTQLPGGDYKGTTVATQQLADGDDLLFFTYQDSINTSDELAWLIYKGKVVSEIVATPGATVKLCVNTTPYKYASKFKDAAAMHALGSPVGGAQIAYIDETSGAVTDIDLAVTDTQGNATVTAPTTEGTRYITAYIPQDTAGEPLIMLPVKLVVDKNAPQADPCALSELHVTTFDGWPNDERMLSPAFSGSVYAYTVPKEAYPSFGDAAIFRSAYVKAAAESEDAVITATCNGVSVPVTQSVNWTQLSGALLGGKNNIISIKVAASNDANAASKTYTVTLPMKPKTNTAPKPIRTSDVEAVDVNTAYTVKLSEIFSDIDEVDTLTYTVAVNDAAAVAADENYSFTPTDAGEYTLVFKANDGELDSAAYTVQLTAREKAQAPTSLTLQHDATNSISGVIIAKKGDTFHVTAKDQDGKTTPVTWKTTSNAVSLNASTGEITISKEPSLSSTSSVSVTATSTLDNTVKKTITLKIAGYKISEDKRTRTESLAADGQTPKTVTVTGGRTGHNIWSWNIPQGVGELVKDPGNGNSIQFKLYRPGVITATFKLDIDETLTDTATITVAGVGVEDSEGNRQKTYLTITQDSLNPTVQLTAYVGAGTDVQAWESADESIATVDSNGLVTAKSVGNTLITATDKNGGKGGILVVVKSGETPYFENVQFVSTPLKDYATAYSFAPTVTAYSLRFKTASTPTLTLQNTTLFDAEKYSATAVYTDINGVQQSVAVKNGAITYLYNMPFEDTTVLITLYEKENPSNKTVYTFTVNRPRDTEQKVKTNGFVLVPNDRALYSALYNGYAEGTMFKLNADGSIKTISESKADTGVTGTHDAYKCCLFGDENAFSLTVSGQTAYTHVQYSTDKINWKELPQGGGTTENITFDNGETEAVLYVRFLSDATYTKNIKNGKDGFADGTPKEYKVVVEKTAVDFKKAQIETANVTEGDWYPKALQAGMYDYVIVVPATVSTTSLQYTLPEGATAKVGSTVQKPTQGVYTLALTTTAKTLTVTSADGTLTNTYTFKMQKRSNNYPDKVLDYLSVNGNYTNDTSYGSAPWRTLNGISTISLGGFGGYVTYYYDTPITDNPNNQYGIDFYVYGNANADESTSTKTSFFEPAQVWVSEDGLQWYALAGSAHYDDGVDWNYSVTYQKTENGKTAWTDNRGNTNNGTSYTGNYPNASVYNMNTLATKDTITLSGIALPSRNGEIAVSGDAVDAYPVKWGYADCFTNGKIGAAVNPYTDNSDFKLQANGFDLQWAVDAAGNPVNVEGKEFHYIKVVTASNIWHSSYGDKSAEIAGVVRAIAKTDAVGKTQAPQEIVISDGAETKKISIEAGKQIYTIDVGNMKYVSVSVNGAKETDNIYVNNTRIDYNGAADGFKITKEGGERLVRVLVQNGEKEPCIYLLKITGSATGSNDWIEGVKINVQGNGRTCETTNGAVYKATVGYRIAEVGLYPIAASDVAVTVNGEPLKEKYELISGENIFTIVGEKNDIKQTVTLKINKESAPASTGKIKVYFTLLGDTVHGANGEVHTLENGKLTKWISKTAIEVDTPATVLDVLEKALDKTYTFVNADGNYISAINGLKEFSNGSFSGWMYTLNGDYTSKGVAEQTVRRGDLIVMHYTDDYTLEGSKQTANRDTASVKPTDKTDKTDKTDNTPAVSDKPLAQMPFADAKSHWAREAILYVYQKGLMLGLSETEFAPDGEITRAMPVTVLYRLANAEEVSAESEFTDVPQDAWYAKAVAWAKKNGIINGISETEFAPDAPVTREQLAVMLYRYVKGGSYNSQTDASQFEDAAQISAWAAEGMAWALDTALLQGTSENTLSPQETATRAQLAMILMRFMNHITQ